MIAAHSDLVFTVDHTRSVVLLRRDGTFVARGTSFGLLAEHMPSAEPLRLEVDTRGYLVAPEWTLSCPKRRHYFDPERKLETLFPGCRVVPWEPVERELQGKPKLALEFIENWLHKHPDGVLPFAVVAKEINVRSQYFTQSIRRHEGFRKALQDLGIEECGGTRRKLGFRRKLERIDSNDI